MNLCPFPNELATPFRKIPFDDVEIYQFHYGFMIAILDMYVFRRMLPIDQEHSNDYPIKPANLRLRSFDPYKGYRE